MPIGYGQFQIFERINYNAYKVDLPDKDGVTTTFNVFDFSLFDVSDYSWTNYFKERGDDTIKTTLKKSIANSNWFNYKINEKKNSNIHSIDLFRIFGSI